jgi:hypothetical protein
MIPKRKRQNRKPGLETRKDLKHRLTDDEEIIAEQEKKKKNKH